MLPWKLVFVHQLPQKVLIPHYLTGSVSMDEVNIQQLSRNLLPCVFDGCRDMLLQSASTVA